MSLPGCGEGWIEYEAQAPEEYHAERRSRAIEEKIEKGQ